MVCNIDNWKHLIKGYGARSHFRLASVLRAAMAARYFCDVEFVNLGCSWPKTEAAQENLLRGLRGWDFHPEIAEYLNMNECRMIGDFTLDAGRGPRWFHVWMHPLEDRLSVIKQWPPSELVVQCDLAAAGQRIHARFAALSGRAFASKAFSVEGISPSNPFLLSDLKEAAE